MDKLFVYEYHQTLIRRYYVTAETQEAADDKAYNGDENLVRTFMAGVEKVEKWVADSMEQVNSAMPKGVEDAY